MSDYYIISAEDRSIQGGLLFWKAEGKGYTGDIDSAGIYSEEAAKQCEERTHGENLAISVEDAKDLCKTHHVVHNPMEVIMELQKRRAA